MRCDAASRRRAQLCDAVESECVGDDTLPAELLQGLQLLLAMVAKLCAAAAFQVVHLPPPSTTFHHIQRQSKHHHIN